VPVGGCHKYPDVFLDDLPDSSMVTTASAELTRQSPAEPVTRQRDHEVWVVDPQDGTVAHASLWLEDPYEMVGSEDGRFAVTQEDFLYFPYGICRFIINVAALPVSIVIAPPSTVLCSDGMPRRSPRTGKPAPYDAERCAGTTIPPDVHETWSFEEQFEKLRARHEAAEAEAEDAEAEPSEADAGPRPEESADE
jgi:hypothetical protein